MESIQTSAAPAIPSIVGVLMADVPDTVIFVLSPDFRPVWCSRSDGMLFGRTLTSWQPGTLGHLFHPDDRAWLQRTRHELLSAPGSKFQGFVRVRGGTGNYSRVLLNVTNHFDNPHVNGLVVTATMIREQSINPVAATRSLSRLRSGPEDLAQDLRREAPLDSVAFSPLQLVEDLAANLRLLTAHDGPDLELDIDADLPPLVRGDRARLERVLRDVVTDARGPAEAPAPAINIAVALNNEERIAFEVSGLDGGGELAVARQLVELMNGSLDHEVIDETATTRFDVLLESVGRIGDRPATPPTTVEPITKHAHVLVVDDSEVNRLLAASQLERLGHTFEVANGSREALDRLTTGTYDAVLMDWHMPGMDGLEVIRRWRSSHDPDRLLPIIVVTASAMAGDRERCIAAGASDYLSKPVLINDLSSAITRWTQATPAVRARVSPAYDQSSIDSLIDDLGDKIVVHSIVVAFVDLLPRHQATARSALADGDHSTIHRSAHTVKSTALMLGFTELADACLTLEGAADHAAASTAADPPGADSTAASSLRAAVAAFSTCCSDAEDSLVVLIAELAPSTDPTGVSPQTTPDGWKQHPLTAEKRSTSPSTCSD